MSSFYDQNQEELVQKLQAYLAKMPALQRENLVQRALGLVGTNDPEKLKQLLQSKTGNLDIDPNLLSQTIDKFLKENKL